MPPRDSTTIKVPKRLRERLSEIQTSLKNKGLDGLDPCIRPLFAGGITQGAIVEACLVLAEGLLYRQSDDPGAP